MSFPGHKDFSDYSLAPSEELCIRILRSYGFEETSSNAEVLLLKIRLGQEASHFAILTAEKTVIHVTTKVVEVTYNRVHDRLAHSFWRKTWHN